MSQLHDEMKGQRPPPTLGTLPPDYQGPIFYRILETVGANKKSTGQHIKFEQRQLAQALAGADLVMVAHRMERRLFDEDGQLLPHFRSALQARVASGAPSVWPEWLFGVIEIVSERVRIAIEDLQPGKHLFVPIDVRKRDGGVSRKYAFFIMRDTTRPVLALAPNGIAYTLAPSGNPLWQAPEWLRTDRFAYLNLNVVRGAAVDFDSRTGLILSDGLVSKLGDVFPKGVSLVRMGAVEEDLVVA